MNLALGDLLNSVEAFAGFAIFFVPPGYQIAYAMRIANFRTLAVPERILWSISISTPVAILMSVLLGRHLSPVIANALVYACATAFVLLLVIRPRNLFRRSDWNRPTRLMVIAMGGLVVYVLLATVGIQVGNRLFEPVASGDWSVRVPLVNAAIHDGVPPNNPFYYIDGHSYPLRYYYFWYVLCGQLGRILHATPRAVLTAGAAWSGIALFSILFLYFKYLFQPDRADKAASSLRRLCLLSLPVSCILGLDIIPTLLGAVTRPAHIFPEMDWWRSIGDFSPSFHTNILYGPHHAAGLACCMTGFLLLTFCVSREGGPPRIATNALPYGVLAGVCFAAAAGTSTYITLFFVVVCGLFALDRIVCRDWITVAALALCGFTAVLLSWGYIHETLTSAGATAHDRHGGHFLAFFPRNWAMTYRFLHIRIAHIGGIPTLPGIIETISRLILSVAFLIVEVGFFGFVLAYRASHDWKNRSSLQLGQRLQWLLFAAVASCGLLVSSSDLIGVNDLGRHAGFTLRFIAVLWATPLIARWLWGKGSWPLLERRWLRRAVLATIILGLSAQLWQVVIQRFYFIAVDAGHLVVREPFPRFRFIGNRYFQTRQAFDALDHILPDGAHIQYNPRSSYLALMTIYLNRPVAAGDDACLAPFGGDSSSCKIAMPQIQALFGGSSSKSSVTTPIPFDPDGINHHAFAAVCARHHLAAIVATASDRVWPEKESWVWNESVLYANSTIRILACPQYSDVMALTSTPH